MKITQRRRPDLWRWLVLGFCLPSFGKGVWDLGEQSLCWNESLSHYRASRPFAFILSNRMTFISGDHEVPTTPDNHPPPYFLLLRLVSLAAGESEFALRFISLVAGVLLVPLLFQAGTWRYGPRQPAIPTRYRRPYRYGGEIALLGHSAEPEVTRP